LLVVALTLDTKVESIKALILLINCLLTAIIIAPFLFVAYEAT
jgi:hypothetical protein